MKIYDDNNLSRLDKKIKIVRVIRYKNGESVDNYFYCSNCDFITPRFVEWCRFYRWKEENGFNAWTNQWQLLKHTFHSSHIVSDAMICLIFMSIIFVENYRKGNLNRGKHTKSESLKIFFRRLIKEFDFESRREFIRFHDYYLNPSTVMN